MKINIVICDDIHEHLEEIKNNIEQVMTKHTLLKEMNYQIITFDSTDKLLNSVLHEKLNPDILITDIKMPENQIDGIEIAKRLNNLAPNCQIVFVTGYLDYAMDVYSTNHIYFVIKSKIKEGIEQALPKAIAKHIENENNKIMIEADDSKHIVYVQNVLYIERQGKRSFVTCNNTTYNTRPKLDIYIELLKSKGFSRCHTSYIVNLNQIKTYKKGLLTMTDGKEISISRKYQKQFDSDFLMNIASNNMKVEE